MTPTVVSTSVTVTTDNPEAAAAMLESFAQRIRNGEIGIGMEGESEERCAHCGDSVAMAWSCVEEDLGEDGEDDDGDGGDEIIVPGLGLIAAMMAAAGSGEGGIIYLDDRSAGHA